MNSNYNENSFLVANFQNYIATIVNHENQYSDLITIPDQAIHNLPRPLTKSNSSNERGSYSICNNDNRFFQPTRNQVRAESESSCGSISPSSSTDSINSSNMQNQYQSIGTNRNLQLPSLKSQRGLAQCFEAKKFHVSNKELICSFCKNNGEQAHIYRSHALKDSVGRITCPLLKVYKCPVCGESGKNAHTITYCKQYKTSQRAAIINNLKS